MSDALVNQTSSVHFPSRVSEVESTYSRALVTAPATAIATTSTDQQLVVLEQLRGESLHSARQQLQQLTAVLAAKVRCLL